MSIKTVFHEKYYNFHYARDPAAAEGRLDGIMEIINGKPEAYEIIANGPARFDELCGWLKKSAGEISSALMMLEMNGFIRQMPGKIYVKVKK